jgi:hypothetical protein
MRRACVALECLKMIHVECSLFFAINDKFHMSYVYEVDHQVDTELAATRLFYRLTIHE